MNPLNRKRVEAALLEELRLCAGGAEPAKAFLRQSIGCSPAELAGAVHALRYAGKISWDKLELSSSMLAGEEPAPKAAVAPIAEEGGEANSLTGTLPGSPPSIAPGPDDEDDEGVNDCDTPPALGRRGHNAHAFDGGFVPKRLLHNAGIHAANTRAARTPLPAPAHEPEIERLVREEVNEGMARRARARSTGTVRQPLEVRKFGIPDLSLSETIGSLLSEEPRDILLAVSRRHPAMWRRCVLLARERGERPIQCLYAAIERGLDELEPQTEGRAQAYGGR